MSSELSHTTKQKIFDLIGGKTTIEEFEQWVYNTEELKEEIGDDDHLELISFNYKKNGAKYELLDFLKEKIDLAEYETHKIRGMLSDALDKNEHLPHILSEFYDLYCRGYKFLSDLGVGFGLSIECPPGYYDSTWEQLPKEIQDKILSEFYPLLDECLREAIDWIDSGKVVLTGESERVKDYNSNYIDNRTSEEKISKVFKEDKNSKIFKEVKKKWWKFW